MSRSIYISPIVVMALLFFLVSFLSRQAPFTVEWKNERLSVIADKAPLSDILQEVDRQTGLKAGYSETLKEEISIRFYDLPLDEGVRKLLASVHPVNPETSTVSMAAQLVSTQSTVQSEIMSANAANDEMKAKNGLLEDAVLHDPNTNTRLTSIQKLIKNDEQHNEDILYAATKDPDPSIRELAYHQLYKLDKQQAIDVLFQDSASPNSDIRMIAIESSAQLIGADAAEMLRNATEDHDPYIKQMAFQQLAHLDGDQGLEALRERLSHADPEIRIMAIEAMASKGEKYANEAALSALNDNDELVRGKAEGLLKELDASGH